MQGFLNVLSIAFEEAEFSSEVGQCQQQRLVDILVHVMLGEATPFSGQQVAYLASFLARTLSSADNTVMVSRDVFTRVLDIVTCGEEHVDTDQRQEAILDILSSDKGWSYFDLTDLEERCVKAGFYRVLEKLYERSNRTDDILTCYLLDRNRKCHVFTWLAKTRVSDAVIVENIDTLMECNVVLMAGIILKYCDTSSDLLSRVMTKLNSRPETLYSLLHCTLSQSHPAITQSMHDRHLQLMCQYDGDQVLGYLSNNDNHPLYDVNTALQLVNTHGLTPAKVYLYERQERIGEAFEILLDILKTAVNGNLENLTSDQVSELSEQLNQVVEFCQRTSELVSIQEREEMWCSLLQTSVQPLSLLTDRDMMTVWRGQVRIVVSSMLGHVSNHKVVTIITSDQGYTTTGSWSEVKTVMGDILDTARYESRLLESTLASIRAETVSLALSLGQLRCRGVASGAVVTCGLCGHSLAGADSSAAVFRCHHVYHVQCLEQGGYSVSRCVLCSSPGHHMVSMSSHHSPSRQQERVSKARDFLKLYNPQTDQGILEPSSIIKADNFPLKLKPEKLGI